ncbi:M23 family metallopeptidase [Microbacterium sp.]|uniref:M23 family metallopeptidase n=1 Tax=Microbacterium sp. TaxID=51671 RepID=UPI003A9163D6
MPAPVIAAAALRTRTGRKIAIGAIIGILALVGVALSPLIAIPFAVAGSAITSTTEKVDAAPVITSDGTWQYPLKGDYFKGRGFGYNPVHGCSYCSTNHMGYDMARACGAPVYAAGVGRVITAGAYQGYGNAVRIDHGHGVVTLYGHMQWSSLRVRVGQQVATGTPLGAEGNTGRSFGCHLHFEVRKSGTPVDPQPFMAAHGLHLK